MELDTYGGTGGATVSALYPSHMLMPDGSLLELTRRVETGDVFRHLGKTYLVTDFRCDARLGRRTVYANRAKAVTVRDLKSVAMIPEVQRPHAQEALAL